MFYAKYKTFAKFSEDKKAHGVKFCFNIEGYYRSTTLPACK